MINRAKLPLYGNDLIEYQTLSYILSNSGMFVPTISDLARYTEMYPNATWKSYPISLEWIPVNTTLEVEMEKAIQKQIRKAGRIADKLEREINFFVAGHCAGDKLIFDKNFQYVIGEKGYCLPSENMIGESQMYLQCCTKGVVMNGHTHPSNKEVSEYASLMDLLSTYNETVMFEKYVFESKWAYTRKNVFVSSIFTNGTNQIYRFNSDLFIFERVNS